MGVRNLIELQTPLSEKAVRALRIGDVVSLSGTIITARDRAHQHLFEKGSPLDLKGGVLYHCGPIINGGTAVSAGPTTSARLERFEPEIIRRFGIRAIIGKGGMGKATLAALKEHGCIYLSAVGGCGALLAKRVERVEGVHFLEEFGAPEAMWVFQVKHFPTVVTMDSHGNSLHAEVEAKTAGRA